MGTKSKMAISFILGIFLTAVSVVAAMPAFMFTTYESRYDFKTTVSKLEASAKSQEWRHSGTRMIGKNIAKHTGSDMPQIAVINLCKADYARKILDAEAYRHVSVMMPCSVSVYNDDSGTTYVATMNTGLMGMMMGGPVREVMSGPVSSFLSKLAATVATQQTEK